MKSLIVIVCLVALTAAGGTDAVVDAGDGTDAVVDAGTVTDTVVDAGTVTDAVVDAGADGAEGGDWKHPPKEGVKVLCFNWNEADPTNMHQSDCNEGPGDGKGGDGKGGEGKPDYPEGSCGHHAWGMDRDG